MQLIECQNKECYFFDPDWVHNCRKLALLKYEECPDYKASWSDEGEQK